MSGAERQQRGTQSHTAPSLGSTRGTDVMPSAIGATEAVKQETPDSRALHLVPCHQTCPLRPDAFLPHAHFFRRVTYFSQVGFTAVLGLPHIILSSFGPQTFTEYPPDQVTELGTPATYMSLLFAAF